MYCPASSNQTSQPCRDGRSHSLGQIQSGLVSVFVGNRAGSLDSNKRSCYDGHRVMRMAMFTGEVADVRERSLKYCTGDGLDLGPGPWKLRQSAIGIDWKRWNEDINIQGSIAELIWFRDAVFDYIFSSHALEDMEDWQSTLNDWLRVIKPSGYLVLYMPHKDRYDGENPGHKHEFDGNEIVEFLRDRAELLERDDIGYSFYLVFRKL